MKHLKQPFAVPITGEYPVAAIGQSRNELLYRGYSIHDLMNNDCCYEEIVYLILRGYLPTKSELIRYKKKLHSYRIPSKLYNLITNIIPPKTHCIDVLKISISYLGILKSVNNNVNDTFDEMDEIIALMPLILLTYNHKLKEYDTSQHNHQAAKQFLNLNTPNILITDEMVDCLNKLMILYTEHGITTSAFTARVVTSSLSDIYSSICAALCAAKGSLHCGANQKALELIMNYQRDVLMTKLKNKEIINGFGHRAYMRNDLRIDPRNKWVKGLAKRLSNTESNPIFARPDLYRNAIEIEEIMKHKKGLFANIDFYGPLVHYQLGIDPSLLTGMICINLCVGWLANIIEQRKAGNRLIRPVSIYVGPKLKAFIPLKSRL